MDSLKVKIGYYSETATFGGAEVYLRSIFEHIDYERYHVVFFCYRNDALIGKLGKCEHKIQKIFLDEIVYNKKAHISHNTKLLRFSQIGGYLRRIWVQYIPKNIRVLCGAYKEVVKLKKVFQSENLAILHFNDTGVVPAVIAAKLAQVPFVMGTFHGLPEEDKKNIFFARRVIEFLSVRCLDLCIAISVAVKNAWCKRVLLNRDRVEVIYDGIDISDFRDFGKHEETKKSIGADGFSYRIGVSGRLHEIKGHEYLLRAMPNILKVIPKTGVILIGDGPLRDELEKLVCNLGIEDAVRFLGYRSDVVSILYACDLIVLPSIAEGLSYSLMEAMACGKPVVASAIGGVPELIEDGVTGILVPPKDSDKLAEAIIKLLKDEELRKKMGEAGRKRAEKYFTQDIMLKKTYGLYERLLNEKRNKYKVAVLSSGLEHVTRGVETWAKDLAYALKDKGAKVTLYKGSGVRNNGFEKVVPCVRCNSKLSKILLKILPKCSWHFGLGSSSQIQQTSFTLSMLPELMVKRFDIIHTQDPDAANILRIANKMGLIRAKVILAHGTEEPFEFIKRFEYLQHLAPYHMEEAVKQGVNGARHFAIPNFVDTERFRNRRNRDSDHFSRYFKIGTLMKNGRCPYFYKDAFVVLSVAAIKRTHKRIDYLINEVAKTNGYLVIAGAKTTQTQELIELGKKRLGDRVIFLTDLPHQRMPEVYAMADVFTLCSLKEMMPIALLEALASGIPCIANKYPVIEWIIGEGGECIDMAKEGELAKTIEKYMDESYRREKDLKAREQAVRKFSKDVVVERIIEMYQEVLFL